MCQFGDSSKIIKELNLEQKNAIRGFRNWYLINLFSKNEKFLKSLNQEFNWSKNELIKADLVRENSLGYYHYNNNYNYNYYYNDNYSYYYYKYNYYNICGTSLNHGKIFVYNEGFRSEFAIPEYLIIIDNQKLIKKVSKFNKHFNNSIINIAKEYNCKTMNWSDYIKLPETIV